MMLLTAQSEILILLLTSLTCFESNQTMRYNDESFAFRPDQLRLTFNALVCSNIANVYLCHVVPVHILPHITKLKTARTLSKFWNHLFVVFAIFREKKQFYNKI